MSNSGWKHIEESSVILVCLFRKIVDVTVYDTVQCGKSPMMGFVQDLGERN